MWRPIAIPGIVALVMGVALALWIYAARPTRAQNRMLALALFSEAIAMGAIFAAVPLLASAEDAWAARGVEYAFQAASGLLYLAFVGTLESPLARPFRSSTIRTTLLFSAGGVLLAWPLLASTILGAGFAAPAHGLPYLREQMPTSVIIDGGSTAIFLFGLLVTLDAWRRAPPGTIRRAQARAYGLAFGLRDLGFASRLLLTILIPDLWFTPYGWYSITLTQIGFLALLAYGILKTQLFDIDLKIKWTLKQSTVAAAFVAVFFAVSEGAAAFFSGAIGTYAGIAAAAILVFALAPLQRLAERLSDRAMPAVDATPAYVAYRKMEVYKAAVEEVLADGNVSAKDRRVLERLRAQLGLSAADAQALEHELTAHAP